MALDIITTTQGKLTGIKMNGYTLYKGIPYAKAPIGELRWKAPQEVEPWEGVLKADHFGSISFQGKHEEGSFYYKEFYSDPETIPSMSEDCLYLNIWVPEDHGDKLPVAFWIHGGAFLHGFGSEVEFDGEAFCKQGIILVTINYRVGALGFLAHPWLSEENELGSSGNYGILDQIAALKWVYENISAFRGDPENITVFGQSAGSISVQTLVCSPLTKTYIKKAILQSGLSYHTRISRDCPLAEAHLLGEQFAKLCGVHSLEELRKLPPETLLAKTWELADWRAKQGYEGLVFHPVIDHYVLLDSFHHTIDQGKHHDIPYMLGSTKNDLDVTEEMLQHNEKGSIHQGCIHWSLKQEELHRNPSYVYYFSRTLPGDGAGAFHSSELWYVFGTLHRSWRPMEEADKVLSGQMVAYWTNFMKYGDPNSAELDPWFACVKANPFVKELK